jgi:ABC-type phosphate transport system substrate-binding protein
MRTPVSLALVAALLGGAHGGPAPAQPPDAARAAAAPAGFVVVVHAGNATPPLTREQLQRLFLRKVTRWPGGAPALPTDLPADSPVRAAFSRQVLARSVASVRAYWQDRIFSGRDVPPPEQPDETEAIAYVSAHPAAVAYVGPGTPLPSDVRPLPVAER